MSIDYAAACRDILDALDEKPGSGDIWAAVDAHRTTLEHITEGRVVVVEDGHPGEPTAEQAIRELVGIVEWFGSDLELHQAAALAVLRRSIEEAR